jgi:hypothetical protein
VRTIVFSTVIENIKSFFAREEELTAQPKAVPEAASEALNRPANAPQRASPASLPPGSPTRIVERPLPLPFTPEQLRAALPRQESPAIAPPRSAQPIIEREVEIAPHEIVAFESALDDARRSVGTRTPSATPAISVAPPKNIPATGPAPFFEEFEQFVMREDMQAEGIIDSDILYRMKEFHRHRQEGKEYYLYSGDMQHAMQRKLADLKSLERDWFGKRTMADQLEKDLTLLEKDIETRTGELRQLVAQAKAKSRLERKVAPGQEFVLTDGRMLASLLDLRVALRTMPETVFRAHVNPTKNDFASWVRGALQDGEIGKEIGKLHLKGDLEMYLQRLG